IAREYFLAVRAYDGDLYIDGVLFHRYSCVLARRQREAVLLRLAASKLAFNRLPDFQLRAFGRLRLPGLGQHANCDASGHEQRDRTPPAQTSHALGRVLDTASEG